MFFGGIHWLLNLSKARGRSKGLTSESMGSCQNYGPFLGPYYNTAPNI